VEADEVTFGLAFVSADWFRSTTLPQDGTWFLAEQLNDDRRPGRVGIFVSNVHTLLGELDESLMTGTRALEIAGRFSDLGLRIHSTNNLEYAHYYRGKYGRVVELAIENLATLSPDWSSSISEPPRRRRSTIEAGRKLSYADPIQAAVVDAARWPQGLKIFDVEDFLRESEGLPETAMVATSVRAEDNPICMLSIKRYGPITMSTKRWHPIWDWTKAEVVSSIAKAGLKLAAEYECMPRSFSGIHAGYLLPIKKHFPKDYAKILEWMPLADAECLRYERAGLAK
jgi:hypothetical protein